MKTLFFAPLSRALGIGPALADGQRGVAYGYQHWQEMNGNPQVPATKWFAERRAPTQQQLTTQSPSLPPAPDSTGHS